ncbi:MAG: TetR/AcrR family transcriptional regulator [Solirubrobacterales bacterium]
MGRPAAADRKPHDIESLSLVAFHLFRKRGYDATSVDQIARAAGITKSSIYHHVSGKEELLDRGITRALDRLFAALEEPPALTGSYASRIRYVLHRGVEIEVANIDEVAVLLRLRGNTKVERRAVERRKAFDRQVSNLVVNAIESGEVRNDLDPPLVTRLLFSMANWLTEWFDPSGPLSASEIADQITSLAFDGLRFRSQPGELVALNHVQPDSISSVVTP